jgi:hypothetical protein
MSVSASISLSGKKNLLRGTLTWPFLLWNNHSRISQGGESATRKLSINELRTIPWQDMSMGKENPVLVLAPGDDPQFAMLNELPHTICGEVAACAQARKDTTVILQWSVTRELLRAMFVRCRKIAAKTPRVSKWVI